MWQGVTLDPVGVAAGLLCAVALAAYWLLGESGQEHRDAVSLTMWGFVFASIAWAVIAPWWTFPWATLTVTTEPLLPGGPAFPVWALMVWGVLLGTIAPFLLVLGSLRRIGAQRAGIVGTTEPLWAAVIGLVLLGETFTRRAGRRRAHRARRASSSRRRRARPASPSRRANFPRSASDERARHDVRRGRRLGVVHAPEQQLAAR